MGYSIFSTEVNIFFQKGGEIMKNQPKFFKVMVKILFIAAVCYATQSKGKDVPITHIMQQLSYIASITENQWKVPVLNHLSFLLTSLEQAYQKSEPENCNRELLQKINRELSNLQQTTSLSESYYHSTNLIQIFHQQTQYPLKAEPLIPLLSSIFSSIHQRLIHTMIDKNLMEEKAFAFSNSLPAPFVLTLPATSFDEAGMYSSNEEISFDGVFDDHRVDAELAQLFTTYLERIGGCLERLRLISENNKLGPEQLIETGDTPSLEEGACIETPASIFQELKSYLNKTTFLLVSIGGTVIGGTYAIYRYFFTQQTRIPGIAEITALSSIFSGLKAMSGSVLGLLTGGFAYYKIKRLLHAECRAKEKILKEHFEQKIKNYTEKTKQRLGSLQKKQIEQDKALAHITTEVVNALEHNKQWLEKELASRMTQNDAFESATRELHALAQQIGNNHSYLLERVSTIEEAGTQKIEKFLAEHHDEIIEASQQDMVLHSLMNALSKKIAPHLPPKRRLHTDGFKTLRRLNQELPAAVALMQSQETAVVPS